MISKLSAVLSFLLLVAGAAGAQIHGFGEYRCGVRIQDDPYQDSTSLNELRVQAEGMWYVGPVVAELKSDFVYDDLANDLDDVDLETGHGFLDLRQASLLFSPLAWVDVKAGRQVLTWGTGDLVFINDLFPKDWQSFFLGRDQEYLKAPSDAFLVSLFPGAVNIDVAYTPSFDADRHIKGERISYWNGIDLAGQDSVLQTDRPNEWFDEDETAVRIYRNLSGYEAAFYYYRGFWKSPGGFDPASGRWLFPRLDVYGASIRGTLAGGIANLEAGLYDSVDDEDGIRPTINNGEVRFLAGYEREVARNVTAGIQYYLESMRDYDEYIESLETAGMSAGTARDENRHTWTLRITWLLMNQNLTLGCFGRYSPSDEDAYIKPSATYKITDRWQASLGGNIFLGEENHTFLGQFEHNSNIHFALRLSI